MKTIKLTRFRDDVPRSSETPFSLKVPCRTFGASGDLLHIHTGWGFDVPDGTELRVVPSEGDKAPIILTWYVENGELVVVCCGKRKNDNPLGRIDLEAGQEYGIVQFVSVEEQDVRFIEFRDGKRVIVGDSQPVKDTSGAGPAE